MLPLYVVGRLVVGHEGLGHPRLKAAQQVLAEVGALARGAADHHHADGALHALAHVLRVCRPGNLAEVVRDGLRRVERADGRARAVGRLRRQEVKGRIVDGKPDRHACAAQVDGVREVNERRARAIVDGVRRAAPQKRDARSRGKRQRGALVAQQHDAARLHHLGHGLGGHAGLLDAAVRGLVERRVPAGGVPQRLHARDLRLLRRIPLLSGGAATRRGKRRSTRARGEKRFSPGNANGHRSSSSQGSSAYHAARRVGGQRRLGTSSLWRRPTCPTGRRAPGHGASPAQIHVPLEGLPAQPPQKGVFRSQTHSTGRLFSAKEPRKPTSLKSGFQWNQNLSGKRRTTDSKRPKPAKADGPDVANCDVRPVRGKAREVLAGQSRGRRGRSGSGRITPIGPDRFRSQLER